jgi:hypothetical protein
MLRSPGLDKGCAHRIRSTLSDPFSASDVMPLLSAREAVSAYQCLVGAGHLPDVGLIWDIVAVSARAKPTAVAFARVEGEIKRLIIEAVDRAPQPEEGTR